MKVTKITVSRGCTVNIGSYESQRAEVGAELELDDQIQANPELLSQVFDKLKTSVEAELVKVIDTMPGCTGRSRDFVK